MPEDLPGRPACDRRLRGVPLRVRTWNVFHGNALPPERRGFLEEMVRLVTADGPDVVCLQEVPVWALRHLEEWSGMAALGAVAARPRLWSAELGRLLTEAHHGLLRSALTGQANAILLSRALRVGQERTLAVSRGGERRVCQAVRVADVGLVGNVHVTGGLVADERFLRAAAFVEAQAERDLREGRSGKAYFEGVLALREEARQGFADLLGVEPSHIAVVDSTSRGCGTVLAGLGLTADDEVITTDQEHFGLIGPVYASGASVVIAEGTEDAILEAVTPRTKLIATSHVLWTTGRRLDLHRVKHESGLPVLVDGAQSAGAIAVDVGELDFYTVSAQKWLCAPEPTGALYVRNPESVRIVAPSYSSQSSYELSGAFVPKEGAARFD